MAPLNLKAQFLVDERSSPTFFEVKHNSCIPTQFLVDEARARYPGRINYHFNAELSGVDLAGKKVSKGLGQEGGGGGGSVAQGEQNTNSQSMYTGRHVGEHHRCEDRSWEVV